MVQYIDKDALVAEIEKLIDKDEYHDGYDCGFRDGTNYALDELKEKINTLEVKEVDLEKEYKEFVEDDLVYGRLVNNIVGKAIAKHFFELGLKVQKGE